MVKGGNFKEDSERRRRRKRKRKIEFVNLMRRDDQEACRAI